MRGRHWIGLAALVVALAVVAGCGGDRQAERPAIALDGRTVPVSELIFEYERLHGVDQWALADEEARRDFADTYAKKELIVRHAQEIYGPELTGEAASTYQRWVNREALKAYRESLQVDPQISQAEIDSIGRGLKEQRNVTDILCRYQEDAEAIYNEYLETGRDIIAIAQEHRARNPELVEINERGWASKPMLPEVIGDAMFSLEEVGDVTPPFETRRFGWMILRLEGARPVDVDWDPIELRAFVLDMRARHELARQAAELEARYDFELVTENVPPVQRRFGARFDSINAADSETMMLSDSGSDGQTPPLHRFSEEELALPLVRWSGGVWTVEDYVRSLELADPPYWPTAGGEEKINNQIERRMLNWAWVREAKRAGVLEDSRFQAKMRREKDRQLVDRFYEEYLERYGAGVTDEDVHAFWEEHRDDYRTEDRVGYGFMRFPSDARDLAFRAFDLLQQGTTWESVGAEMQHVDSRVIFEPSLRPTAGPPYPQITEVALAYDVLPDGSPAVIEPVEINGEWVVLRVYSRIHREPVDFEMADRFVRRDLQRLAMEDSLVAMLDELAERYELKIHWNNIL